MRQVLYTKYEILEQFARNVSNADRMMVDFKREVLTIQFGQYQKEYDINHILKEFSNGAKQRGFDVVYKAA